MKKLFTFILCFFALLNSSYASQNINLNYKITGELTSKHKFQIKNNLQLPTNNSWQILGGVSSENQFLILTKINKIDNSNIETKLLFIEHGGFNKINEASLILKLNESKNIKLDNYHISIIAS